MAFMLRCLLFLISFNFRDICRSFFVMTSFSFRRLETPLVKQSWSCYLWLTRFAGIRPTICTVSPSVHDLEEHPAKNNMHSCIGSTFYLLNVLTFTTTAKKTYKMIRLKGNHTLCTSPPREPELPILSWSPSIHPRLKLIRKSTSLLLYMMTS